MAPKVVPTIACRVATFNCKNLSTGNAEKIDWIADQIRDSDCSIVALQEVSKLVAIGQIIDILGEDYGEVHNEVPIDNSRVSRVFIVPINKMDLGQKSSAELAGLIRATKRKPIISDTDRALIRRAIELYREKTAGQRAKAVWGSSNINLTARG